MLGVELSDGRRELLPGCARLTAPEDAATFLSRRAPPKLPLLSLTYGFCSAAYSGFLLNSLFRYTFWWVFPSIRAANRRARLAQEDLPKLPRVDPWHRIVSPENVHVCLILFAKDDPEFLFSKVASLWRSAGGKSARILCSVCWRIQWRAFWLVYAGYLQSLNR